MADIHKAKTMTTPDWERVARNFADWRKTVTLTRLGRWLGHTAAWDIFCKGYSDGVEEGVNRALGVSDEDAVGLEELMLRERT